MMRQFDDSGAKVLLIVDMFADKLAEVVPKTGTFTVVLAGVAECFPKRPEVIIRGVRKPVAWVRDATGCGLNLSQRQSSITRKTIRATGLRPRLTRNAPLRAAGCCE
jgi:hypothetical protein